jgi:alpha-tubulin suppressor-like RCC1 family protein
MLTRFGTVWCWGDNSRGQLGVKAREPNLPGHVDIPDNVIALSAGIEHTCALTSAPTGPVVWCWGRNDAGQLGDGSTSDRPTPVAIPGSAVGAKGLAAGDRHTCAIFVDGMVGCWGANEHGQLGNGSTSPSGILASSAPLAFRPSRISAGIDYTCALGAAGELVCWGWNVLGQLGTGNADDSYLPVAVDGF